MAALRVSPAARVAGERGLSRAFSGMEPFVRPPARRPVLQLQKATCRGALWLVPLCLPLRACSQA